MPTVTMERLDEIATAWRRGLDTDELPNPAGPLFGDGDHTEYEITTPMAYPVSVVATFLSAYVGYDSCMCCRVD